MKYLDVVLNLAKTQAWEALSDEQRAAHLQAACRSTGGRQPKSIIKRWAIQTGPDTEKLSTGMK